MRVRRTVSLFALLASTWAPLGVRAASDTALRLANASAANTSYVRIPNSAAFSLQQLTIEAWVQRVGPGFGAANDAIGGAVVGKPAEGTVGSFLGPWYLTWSNAGQAFFSVAHTAGVNGVALQTAAVATPLSRHHLAAVVAADSVRVYVDGVRSASAPWTLGTVLVNTNDVLIGAANFGAGFLRRFDGAIDDVRIWDHARTTDQIVALMNCRLTGSEPGLVAYYPFDASDLADATGHAHSGAAVATAGSLTFASLAALPNCTTDAAARVVPELATLNLSPQPTHGSVRARFSLPRSGHVTLTLYDVAGRRRALLSDGTYERGEHVVTSDLALAPGRCNAELVFVRLDWSGRAIVRPIVVLPR